MNKVHEVLHEKGRQVHITTPQATALAAAQMMNDHRVGSLVVMEGGRIAGIVTERDMLTRVIAAQRDPVRTRVADVMTRDVHMCSPQTDLDELRSLMRERRVRHIPVVHDGALAGIVSIGDLNAAEAKSMSQTIGFLEAYIAG